ncbi:hypothetical protein ACJMK2_039339 [Sinanodonta woodiana]|uniref:EF-hand domain-containing protein n=1 Tax=Sinanodonta woodiana TaxID=1069815 RepID=A0ABD3WBM4_SINWO
MVFCFMHISLSFFLLEADLYKLQKRDEGERAVLLFDKVDVDHTDHLTYNELEAIFGLFDANNDSTVTQAEFLSDWTDVYKIGGPGEAQGLFQRADTNGDGVITKDDMPAIFKYFDMDGDHYVDLNEFLTQWGQLMLFPSRPVDIGTVHLG